MPDSTSLQDISIGGGIVLGLSALGTILRGCFKLLAGALNRNSRAIENNEKAFNDMSKWFGRVDARMEDEQKARVDARNQIVGKMTEIHDEISGTHTVPPAFTPQPFDDDDETPVDSPIPKRKIDKVDSDENRTKKPRARTNPKLGG